jgi:hypothetical protein
MSYFDKRPTLKDDGESGAFSYSSMVIGAIVEARHAKAECDYLKYISLFEDVLHYLIPHIPEEDRMKIQADVEKLELYEQSIEADILAGKTHVETGKAEIQEAKLKFCRDKEMYVYMAIPRAGLHKKESDGIIKFDESDIPYESLTTIIRAKQGGTPSTVATVLRHELPGDNYVKIKDRPPPDVVLHESDAP